MPTNKTPAKPGDIVEEISALSAWGAIQLAQDKNARYEAAQAALAPHHMTRGGKEVPNLAVDLPWADDQSAVTNILTSLILADDITEVTGEQAELTKLGQIIDLPVQVFDLRARESDIEGDGSWGLYLSLDLSVRGGPREIVNTGARQVIVTFWRLFCEGKLPVQGVFVKLGNAQPGRNQPIGFRVEMPLA